MKTSRWLSILLVMVMVLAMATTAFAGVLVTPMDPDLVMYAEDFTVGDIVPVNMDAYLPDSQLARLNPTNALGEFDATAPAGVSDFFFATGARTWSHFTFEDAFMNVDGAPDIEFAEVTWGSGGSWHTEAVMVYLTGAYVKDTEGNVVPYGAVDGGIGYYAGIAWNRIGLQYVDNATRLSVTESYFAGPRDFEDNVFYSGGPYEAYTQFHLPDEVVYAEGVHLVDITKIVNILAYPATFSNAPGAGALVTLDSDAWDVPNYTKITAADVTAVSGTDGNTDGYDLDAIRVYKYVPPTYEIEGYKYRSGTEIGLGGWEIVLEKWIDNAWVKIDSKVTDINGFYSFEDLLMGNYRVSETPKFGWEQTYPIGDVYLVRLPYEGEALSFDFHNEPEMKCYDDTIWAYGGEDGAYTDGAAFKVVKNNEVTGNTSNNWGWTNQITAPGEYVWTLYRGAGQNDLEKGTPVGTLTVVYDGITANITYSVVEPYKLSEVHLWVGETELPMIESTKKGVTTNTPTSAPGQLAKLGFSPEISTNGLSATIIVEIDAPFWVAAHGVVDWCEMVALPEAMYYHWGVGYPYGATPEVFATASVSTEGIMDVYWYGNGVWFHDIYHSSQPLTWPVQNLNPPVKMLHELYFPGVTLAHYSRVEVDLSLVPLPNAMSIYIPSP